MADINRAALVNQLISMRAAIDAALSILAVDVEQECQHQNVKEMTVFGGPRKFHCNDCGKDWEE